MAEPDQTLTGRRALVTGASKGIGRAVATALAGAGAAVVVNYRSDRDGAETLVADITRRGGTAHAVQADISTQDAVAQLFAAAEEKLGGLDILVANAGIQRDAPLLDMSFQDWEKVIAVNLTGQFLCAQAAARQFIVQGHPVDGARALGNILFISSVHQRIPWAGRVNYTASKGGVKLMMESMAQELAPRRIRVNAIAPGAIRTDINRSEWQDESGRAAMLEQIPYGRIGDPEDIARAAAWLVSDAADYVVGATLFVDGGMALYPSFQEG